MECGECVVCGVWGVGCGVAVCRVCSVGCRVWGGCV